MSAQLKSAYHLNRELRKLTDINLNDLSDYISKKTDKKLAPLRFKAQTDKNKCDELIQKIIVSAGKFSSSKDRELFKSLEQDTKRHDLAVKASEKLTQEIMELIESLKVDRKNDYNSLTDFNDAIRSFFIKLNEVGRKWVPKMSPWFKTELKEFDYYIRKLADQAEKTRAFLSREYKEVEKIDKLLESVANLKEALKQKNIFQEKLALVKAELEQIEEQVNDEEKKYSKFRESGIQKDHSDLDEALTNIRRGFNIIINPVLKPLTKFIKSPSPSIAELDAYQRNLIEKYISEPFNTFVGDDNGVGNLKKILAALKLSLHNRELDLKQDRIDKAIKQISKLIDGSLLNDLYEKAKKTASLKDALKVKIAEKGLIEKAEDMKSRIGNLESQRVDKRVEYDQIENQYKSLMDKIKRESGSITERIKEIIGEEVNIILT